MDWSPDGRYLVYSHREGPLSPGRAVLIDLSDTSQQDVLTPEDPTASVEDVAFSPDGTQIAHTLVVALGVEDIYVHSLADGSTKRITFDNLKIHGFDWFPDGSGFAMSSNRGGEFSLWRVPLDGSGPTLIPGAVGGADEPKVSNQGGLVYEAWRASAEIWRLDLGSEKEPEVFLSSTRYEWDAQRSPDGQRLTFISDRSGAAEVWVSAADGSERIRLTNFGGAYTHTPRFSPDGRQIAFATPADGNFDVYVVDVDATTPRRLTTHPSEDFAPCWSPGGRSIYFGSTRSGRWQIWRFDLDDGTTHQITVNGGRAAQVSPDGRYLYYIKVDRPGLWRSELSRKGIPEERVIPNLEPVDWNNWIVLENAIYYVRRPVPSEPEIVRYDLANANTKRIRKLPALLYKSGVWVSPDESEMLFTQVATREADIMLLADVY
jgi:Tol biopolymer transport system component